MDISVFGLGTVAAITVLSRRYGRENHAAGQQVHTGHLRRHWPRAGRRSSVCGHAGVPGNGPHHGGSCGRGVRPCGHGHQSGYEAAWQNRIIYDESPRFRIFPGRGLFLFYLSIKYIFISLR